METLFAATVLGMLLGDAGMPDKAEREYADHTKRVCAAAKVHDATMSARECIIDEMERKRAALLKDLRAGEWKR